MAGLLQQVATFVAQHELWRPDAALLVAVSGGPDSLALLHLLARLRHSQGLTLHVAHFDHGLRPESGADADFVAATAAEWGLSYVCGSGDVRALAPTYGGVEAAARAARYGFLRDTARALGTDAVVTGHHADDQAETVLMRILRGAGPTGLAAMRPRLAYAQWRHIGLGEAALDSAHDDGPALVRPFLRTERATILAYCAEHGLDPRQDITNSSPDYLRNRVRGYIIPLLKSYNSNIVGALGRIASISADEDALLVELLEREWPTMARTGERAIGLLREPYERLHRALQRRALRKAAAELEPAVELGADHLDRMLYFAGRSQGRLQLPGGLAMQATRKLIIVERVGR